MVQAKVKVESQLQSLLQTLLLQWYTQDGDHEDIQYQETK